MDSIRQRMKDDRKEPPEKGEANKSTDKRPVPQHKGLGEYLREFLRPRYHLHKIQEDVKASVHALKNRDLEVLKYNEESLGRAIRGRLLAAYFLVGPFGALGPIVGVGFQYWVAAHLPFPGFSTYMVILLVGNFFSTLGFQIIWGVSSRTLYRGRQWWFYDFLSMWRDILPLQWQGLKRWAVANVFLVPMASLALSLIDKFLPLVSKNVPLAILVPFLELLFVHTSLIRLMGDLFEVESHRIAANHAHPVTD